MHIWATHWVNIQLCVVQPYSMCRLVVGFTTWTITQSLTRAGCAGMQTALSFTCMWSWCCAALLCSQLSGPVGWWGFCSWHSVQLVQQALHCLEGKFTCYHPCFLCLFANRERTNNERSKVCVSKKTSAAHCPSAPQLENEGNLGQVSYTSKIFSW